jgi:uncharacterized protein (DUF1697 family)
MGHLRNLFEGLGFSNVETFIASGNVIFDSTSKSLKTLEKKIEGHLKTALGYEVATFIRSTSELAAVADYKPFSDAELNGDGHGLYIAFLENEPSDATKRKVLSLKTPVDEFHIFGSELYWLCRKKFSESEVSATALSRALGMQSTTRNSTTIKKIVAKYP